MTILRTLTILLFPVLAFGAETVVCFGDSITEGKNPGALKKEERWVEILQARAGVRAKFVNEGKGGRPASALEEFRQMLARNVKNMDVLVIALGTNDSRDTAENAADKYARNLETMIRDVRALKPDVRIVLCAPYNINIAGLKKNAELGPVREKNLKAFGAAAKAVAEKERVLFVDLYGVLPADSLASDGVHPDNTGHAKIAQALWPSLPLKPQP